MRFQKQKRFQSVNNRTLPKKDTGAYVLDRKIQVSKASKKKNDLPVISQYRVCPLNMRLKMFYERKRKEIRSVKIANSMQTAFDISTLSPESYTNDQTFYICSGIFIDRFQMCILSVKRNFGCPYFDTVYPQFYFVQNIIFF